MIELRRFLEVTIGRMECRASGLRPPGWSRGWPVGRAGECAWGGSERGLEFVEAGNPDGLAQLALEPWLAETDVERLAHGIGHRAEPGVEDV